MSLCSCSSPSFHGRRSHSVKDQMAPAATGACPNAIRSGRSRIRSRPVPIRSRSRSPIVRDASQSQVQALLKCSLVRADDVAMELRKDQAVHHGGTAGGFARL
jgi:hypothetical protein